jgi:hypothetical protein
MGHENTTILIATYDEQVLLPLLMEVHKSSLPFLKNLKHLNPQMVAILGICFTPLTQLPTHGQRLLEKNLMVIVDIQLMQTLANVLGLGGRSKSTSFQQLPAWQDISWASQLTRLKSNEFFQLSTFSLHFAIVAFR